MARKSKSEAPRGRRERGVSCMAVDSSAQPRGCLPPLVVHDVLDPFSLDVDWILHGDMATAVKKLLQGGSCVGSRSSGWSLAPRLRSNFDCVCVPVTSPDEISSPDDWDEKDIVFCEVQPSKRFCVHLVKSKLWDKGKDEYRFTISNYSGRESGWCYMEHIYGKRVEVNQ